MLSLQLNPDKTLATLDDLKQKRLYLEFLPIEISVVDVAESRTRSIAAGFMAQRFITQTPKGEASTNIFSFDVDLASMARLAEQVEYFDSLATLNGDGTLTWILSDDTTHDFTKAQLTAALEGLKRAVALRRAVLYDKYLAFKADIGTLKVEDIVDANWV